MIQLRELLSLTGDIAARIRYCAEPLPELIAELCGREMYTDCVFLKRVNDGLRGGETVQEAWSDAARTTPFFSAGDREIIADIGARLGSTDTEGQLSMLSLASDMLSRSLDEAERECEKKARTLLGVWTMCGIGAGIVIL